MSTLTTILSHVPATILSIELFLGGQCRITPLLTPTLYERVMKNKSQGTQKALWPVIPIRDPKLNTNFIGVLMCLAGGLVANPATRGGYGALGLTWFLTLAGVHSQRKMGIPYWLPITNTVLMGLVWAIERWRVGKGLLEL